MMKGTIVENSLADKSILERLQVTKTWSSGDWTLHDVLVSEEQVGGVGACLADGPWYVHFWKEGEDDVTVVYRDATFKIRHSDRATWKEAVAHGRRLGIPEAQLDFIID